MPLQAFKAALSSSVPQEELPPAEASVLDYPMREYIGGMTRELARMARDDGDEMLAVQLESASDRAALPGPVQVATPAIQSAA